MEKLKRPHTKQLKKMMMQEKETIPTQHIEVEGRIEEEEGEIGIMETMIDSSTTTNFI